MTQHRGSKAFSSRSRFRQRGLFLASVLTVLAAGSTAAAASREAKERVARAACLAGDYKKGVAILSQLFVESGNPTYIYNQGRCFEQNGRYREAITRFKEYLRVGKKVSQEYKTETQRHIDDCQALLAAESGQAPAISPAAPAPVAVGPAPGQQPYTHGPSQAPSPFAPGQQAYAPIPAQASVAPPYAAPPYAVQVSPPSTVQRGSGLRTSGIITGAVGGAALVGGVVFNIKANSIIHDFQTVRDGYSASKESERQTYETLGWVCYGVGAASVATGAVLYYLGLRSSRQVAVTIAPVLGPRAAMASVRGVF